MEITIKSETGRLNGVIVQTPGREVSLVHPDNKNELLFDDIIFESAANQEHQDMIRIFETAMPHDGKVFEIVDLIAEMFGNEEARSWFVESLIRRQPELRMRLFEKELLALNAGSLTRFAVEGQCEALPDLHLLPSPNLLFTSNFLGDLSSTFFSNSEFFRFFS